MPKSNPSEDHDPESPPEDHDPEPPPATEIDQSQSREDVEVMSLRPANGVTNMNFFEIWAVAYRLWDEKSNLVFTFFES